MKNFIKKLKNKILAGGKIEFQEAKELIEIKLDDAGSLNELFFSADEIREKFCGNSFDLCTIINAKSGKCSEDCKYCAQSSHFKTNASVYPLVNSEIALEEAKKVEREGANRFSLVTSGKGILSDSKEMEKLENIYKILKERTTLSLCASHGICDKEVLVKLKEAGVTTYHHNLEACKDFYPNICSTHTYEDRVKTVLNAKEVGLRVCSGGILGLGETPIDRIKLAFELRELDVDSVPINILTPIAGTPLENAKEIEPLELIKTMSVFRFILPNKALRYAGGRIKLGKYQSLGIRAGINSALTGNFLTTTGNTIESDKKMIEGVGYEIK
ncbi:MAG: biotin synthase BioB [Fusobacterium sp.]|nr:biotin synthase BioB [Fusobacterium sp.]